VSGKKASKVDFRKIVTRHSLPIEVDRLVDGRALSIPPACELFSLKDHGAVSIDRSQSWPHAVSRLPLMCVQGRFSRCVSPSIRCDPLRVNPAAGFFGIRGERVHGYLPESWTGEVSGDFAARRSAIGIRIVLRDTQGWMTKTMCRLPPPLSPVYPDECIATAPAHLRGRFLLME
jgi:hypothetical protein